MIIQEDYFKNIFNTVREAILVLDENMRVLSANRSFFNIFKVDYANTVGSLLYDLGNKQWNIPHLRVLLEDILPKNDTVDDYEIEHEFESIGHKTMLLNACKIREKNNDLPIILLAIEDITGRREIEAGLEKTRKELEAIKIDEDEAHEYAESIINTVREPLIALDQNLRVVSASRSFYEVFKVNPKETVGQLIYDLGNKQWDIPRLRQLLETILPQQATFDNYEVEHEFSTIGRRIMLLNARQIHRVWGKKLIILLAIEDITERKEIETGLEKTRKELVIIRKTADEASAFAESIIDTVREPLIALDQDLRVVAAGRSFYLVFKVTPEETVGQLIYDLGNKQWDIPKLRELLETILPLKTTFDNYEVEHDFAAIGRRIMLLNARQIKRAFGKERIILLAIEDITERKRLEDLLAESEMQYRRLFETASDGIVLLEKNKGHIVSANPATCKMLGYSEEEYTGKMLQDIGVSLDMSDFPAIMQALDKNGILNYEDVPVKTRSGQYIDTDIYMVDRAKLAQCNIRDVTERKRVEEALRESEAKFRTIIDVSPVPYALNDEQQNITYLNSAFVKTFGYDLEDIPTVADWWPRAYPDAEYRQWVAKAWQERLDKAKQTGTLFEPIELNIRCKDGTLRTAIVAAASLGEKFKDVHLVTLYDITERKRAKEEKLKLEDQLRHSQKMEAVGTLAGGIAHDFNNILNVILGYGTMVLDRLGDDKLSKEHLNEVLTAAERAANLSKRLLVFSRKQAVEVKPVNINELILGLQKMLVRIISESIEFDLDLADSPLIVLADAGQIEQVLMNLASNARDAMPEGGRLTIGTGIQEIDDEYVATYGYGKPGRYALITVADTGQGMDAETREKIFEPFFTTKCIGEGTGLGLAISYGIVKQHNGYLKVYSELGKGTEFKIYLPLVEETAELDKQTEAPVSVKGGNETILLAEDDASLRKLERIVLESYGYTVITAEDGEEAITIFMENRERISLALIDMIMPKKNGKEVVEAIKKVGPLTKIIFMSGYTMDIITTRELTEAGFDFLHKPVLPRDLLKKVREVLDRGV